MGAISKYLGDAILNEAFRGVNYVPPAKVYLALYTSNPGDTNTGVEVSTSGYARQEVAFSALTFVSGKSTISNTLDLVFPVTSTSWGTISHVGILDALIGGNLLYYGQLATSKLIDVGDQFKVVAENLVLNID